MGSCKPHLQHVAWLPVWHTESLLVPRSGTLLFFVTVCALLRTVNAEARQESDPPLVKGKSVTEMTYTVVFSYDWEMSGDETN